MRVHDLPTADALVLAAFVARRAAQDGLPQFHVHEHSWERRIVWDAQPAAAQVSDSGHGAVAQASANSATAPGTQISIARRFMDATR